jgi:hypothetical protein
MSESGKVITDVMLSNATEVVMDSKKQEKQERAKGLIKGRRAFLQMGAVGAALLATNLLAPNLNAADQPTRSAAKEGVQKSLHSPVAGKAARKPGALRAAGELAPKPTTSGVRATKKQATRAAVKTAKSAAGERAAGTRMTAQVATKKAMKVQAQ